ncbi:211_t:CDS:2 [Entrophospora sp. SA101]|nr:211_t:CDS:2 [Entrophospora sp. SA101]
MPSLDVQIQKLEKTLLSNEAYINYLEKEISNRDEGLGELEILRKNNMDLQKRLKKALLDTEYKEESLVILDSRISNLQQEIIDLKNRIQDITSRKKKLAMARAPNANEIQTLGETVRNAFNNINKISNWETNRANRAQAQINQDAKTIIKLNAAARIADEELSLMTRVYHNERQARRNMQSLYNKKNRRNDLFLSDIQIDTKWGKWKNRCRNSEQIITNLNQNIFNLQQQILALNNNPQNMATVIECSNVIAPSLATIPEYIGQEHPDTWYERITKLFLHPIIDGNVNFTDAHKVSVLSSKMAGPYHP